MRPRSGRLLRELLWASVPLPPDLSHPNFIVRGCSYINLLDVCDAEIGFYSIDLQTHTHILTLLPVCGTSTDKLPHTHSHHNPNQVPNPKLDPVLTPTNPTGPLELPSYGAQ